MTVAVAEQGDVEGQWWWQRSTMAAAEQDDGGSGGRLWRRTAMATKVDDDDDGGGRCCLREIMAPRWQPPAEVKIDVVDGSRSMLAMEANDTGRVSDWRRLAMVVGAEGGGNKKLIAF